MECQEEIRRLAYRIWEEEGHPQGRDIHHWLMAETIWQDKHQEQDKANQSKARRQTTTRRKQPEEKRTRR